ncbi:universal stress protein [Desulfosarcina sp.]|uniref:universal stress protein n=1 Tax=Desulfosarcina sp. TaxID=2027861 RepID=UPI0029A3C1C8|nr:universal stress protein [Desulfosarcina sp.]MDX2454353.1 universal stress protein [Desulfosarcina sp.]MDX2492020.1 universal stress protein [Desulfosarcina sp.]
MLPQIKNILYATDLSENARYAYNYAASLGQQYSARITILHVVEKLTAETFLQIHGYVGEEKWKKLQEEKQADFISTIKGRLSNFCDEISNEVDACTFQVDKIIVKEGIATDEILHQADLNDADLIIMGTRGLGMFKEALMGGTARRVVRRSTIPVMVVRLPE